MNTHGSISIGPSANMNVYISIGHMCHEYKGSCILGETLLAKLLGDDLTYYFICPLSDAPMGSRH